MSLLRSLNVVSVAAMLLAGTASDTAIAQTMEVCKNQYPCGRCAVYDNNGNDLAGFTRDHKLELMTTGGKVDKLSGSEWGYLLMRTVEVPSVSNRWDTKGALNHTASIRAALVMHKTMTGAEATWWARECNRDRGPIVQLRVKNVPEMTFPEERHQQVMSNLLSKKFTLVEYIDTFNARDFDFMLKSYMAVKAGVIEKSDYGDLINYYNGFLSKFSYIDDPVLSKMSFVTFFEGGSKTRYVGYFNIVNSKLSGRLERVNIEYARDRDFVVDKTFSELTGTTVYVYGDDSFGLDKTIIKYGKDEDLKLRRRTTSVTTKFNDER